MKIVEDFEKAVRDHELKGSMHLEDYELVELIYQTTKDKLIRKLKGLQDAAKSKA